jgi:glyoxylase-like metal-dependent hydrolase (beta-lactamase superfamily II)
MHPAANPVQSHARCGWYEIVDTHQFGLPRIGAAYVVTGRLTALIDTGTCHATEEIVSALGTRSPDHVLLTHVHPDHAGAAALLADRYPEAVVGVHTRGLPHLLDPSRLNESIRQSTGALTEHYGLLTPLRAEQGLPLADGDEIALGNGIRLQVVESPGHSAHHLCFFEPTQRVLFCGDAVGINRTGEWIPATVPPSFDLEASIATLNTLRTLQPRLLLLSHYGPQPASDALWKSLDSRLRGWVRWITALSARLPADQVVEAVSSSKRYATLSEPERNELRMCIRGVLASLQVDLQGERLGNSSGGR